MGDFREKLISLNSPRVLSARGLDPFEYGRSVLARRDAQFLVDSWLTLYAEPFKGITVNGEVEKGLFDLADEGFDIAGAVKSAQAFLDSLNQEQRSKVRYPINAREWRSWYNPEWQPHSFGLRLDRVYVSDEVRTAADNLMRSCLAPEGYAKIEETRLTNLYLGELYDLRNIMSEWSYHFFLFGTPSLTEPWGWSICGHHLSVNCFILNGQIVVSPVFLGAEPNLVDHGPRGGFRVFEQEEALGLELIRSLAPSLRERAIIFKTMVDPAMPEGRWHYVDERHLGGAFQDNRIIGYEGVSAAEFTEAQREVLLRVIESFINYLPDKLRAARMSQIASKLDTTYFSWIGGYGEEDPFYYRVQSPLIMVEFDHHSGVWLTNADPERFHIHTIVRTPNGNDYGRDLLRQYYERLQDKHLSLSEVDREPFDYQPGALEAVGSVPMTRAEHDQTDDSPHHAD